MGEKNEQDKPVHFLPHRKRKRANNLGDNLRDTSKANNAYSYKRIGVISEINALSRKIEYPEFTKELILK